MESDLYHLYKEFSGETNIEVKTSMNDKIIHNSRSSERIYGRKKNFFVMCVTSACRIDNDEFGEHKKPMYDVKKGGISKVEAF